ncbi:MAG: GspH/FimT family protein, partial [Pseudomonadales bacterium]|nr:GspH/FimT family protein [Pseudomonadales bacterium]
KQADNTLVMCASSDSSTCDTNNWESGWIIFIDEDADNSLDGGEELVRVVTELAGDNTLRTTGFTNLGFLSFDNDGVPDAAGTFTLCDSRGADYAKASILTIVGHTRLGVDESSPLDGIVNTHLGSGVNALCP